MVQEMQRFFIGFFAEVGGEALVIVFGEHAVPNAGLRVIRIAGLIGFAVMDVVGDHIDLFGKGPYDKILGEDAPYRIAEGIGLVRTIPVKPNCSVGTHDDHAVEDDSDHQIPGKIFEQEEIEEGEQADQRQEADKGDPVLFCFENIDAGKGFGPKLLFGGDDQGVILVFPAVGRHVKKIIDKGTFNHVFEYWIELPVNLPCRLRFFGNAYRVQAFWTFLDGIVNDVSFADLIGRLIDMKKDLFPVILDDKAEAFRAVKIVNSTFP